MRKAEFLILVSCLLLMLFGVAGAAEQRLRLATTTSTENSGLLEVVLPPFEEAHDVSVDVIAVGTGKALKLGETGDVDVVLVHARKLENQFVDAGYGVNRRDVMYNDFVLLGPGTDPAGVGKVNDVRIAMQRIAAVDATFVSRGDLSGTHAREKSLWSVAGVVPKGDWYLEAGRGMGEVLTMADQRNAYTLADRGTYLAYRDKIGLVVLLENDKHLFNPYGVIQVNPARHPHVQSLLAWAFVDYLTSDATKKIINGYRRAGERLFTAHED